ncbi:hypothetical protein NPX13_g1588 [Xylaria arbuscula]|uniref:Uncharacterized protein n=1 Tax=Xylaria arbuscula TaxID=114810 RepID=A0A9W8TR51_9PEZI|nr:hypothetical protein NPX13_g1588 [Xylaria arbuscula]
MSRCDEKERTVDSPKWLVRIVLHMPKEMVYILLNPQTISDERKPYLGYHSEANACLIEDCLNWAKGSWIPVVLLLIAEMSRADPVTQVEYWAWPFNELMNSASFQHVTHEQQTNEAWLPEVRDSVTAQAREVVVWVYLRGPDGFGCYEAIAKPDVANSAWQQGRD